ncbi:exopolysaccharide Pel transporter PelG [Streptococcus henryi]|uniref:exopolysaccharide Pel transporter PelG n=1 Tax=Streptococcus henryi TaxID=439219 RepID=UPI0003615BB9|nr:exopolysaccharide Pel transporter PelG [Streptococcus henryi]
MAGIGFAINKIVREKKLTSKPRAFAYASIVTVAPLLFGELVLLTIYSLSNLAKVTITDRNLIVAIITYGLLGSLFINGFVSLVISRYLSDKIFSRDLSNILTSYLGSQFFSVFLGGILYGIFLLISRIGFIYGVLAWILFCEFLLSWNVINFLTIINDYLGIVKAFFATILTTLIMSSIFLLIHISVVVSLLAGIIFGYASFLILATNLLCQQFPNKLNYNQMFDFLKYFDKHWKLAIIGLCTQLGLLGHIVVIWFSQIGQQVRGLFYIAPYYDLTVFLASLTMLASTVQFIISIEVDFFKSYRYYYLSFTGKCTLQEIRKAERDMTESLKKGMKQTVWVQLIVTLLSISVGTSILNALPLGFNTTMNGYFRILCVAYAIYGLANIVALSTYYFGNLTGSYWTSITFAVLSILATVATLYTNTLFYGFGFLIATMLYFIISWINLEKITSNLMYQILGRQPIVFSEKKGIFYRFAIFLNKKMLVFTKEVNYEE